VKVAVVVPRRGDGGRRDELWRWVRDRWAREHPEFAVHEGHHDDGPFNRAAALNRAIAAAGDVDVYVIADSDSFVGADQLDQAIDLATSTGQITFAYDRFSYLSRSMSDRIMAGFNGAWEPGVEWSLTGSCSSMVVVPAPLWAEMGAADEGFVGWGGEDIAISLALQTFGGGLQRVPGVVWHLWHEPAPHTHDDVWPDRMRLYEAVAYDPPAMRALIARLRAEVHG